MNVMCRVITPYICPICNKDTLFFLSRYNKLIDYKSLIKNGTTLIGLKNYLSVKDIESLKCINCNEKFIIDWRNGYPTILQDTSILDKFTNN